MGNDAKQISWKLFYTHFFYFHTAPKIRYKYSKKWSCMASFQIATFMNLWAIYIFLWLVRVLLYCVCGLIVGVEIGNEAAQFHTWEYLFQIFDTVHLQCVLSLYANSECIGSKNRTFYAIEKIKTYYLLISVELRLNLRKVFKMTKFNDKSIVFFFIVQTAKT